MRRLRFSVGFFLLLIVHQLSAQNTQTISALIDSLNDVAYSLEFELPDSALSIYTSAISLASSIDNSEKLGKSMIYKGTQFINMGQYDSARYYLEQSIDLNKGEGHTRSIAVALNNLGNIEQFTSRLEKALAFYIEAIPLFESIQDTAATIMVNNNLGSVLSKMNFRDQSIEYYKKNIALSKAIGDSARVADSYVSFGTDLLALGDTLQAREAFEAALSFDNEHRSNTLKILCHTGLTDVYYGSDPTKSLYHILEANKYAIEDDDQYYGTNTFIGAANGYMRLKEFGKVKEYLDEGLRRAYQMSSLELIVSALDVKYKYEAHTDLYKQSYETFTEYTLLKDSLYNTENAATISTLEAQFQSSKKDLEIANQRLSLQKNEQALENQRNLIISAFILLSLLIVILVLTVRNNKIRKMGIIREQEVKSVNAMVAGEEKERSRIARELHDGVAGSIAAIRLQLENSIDQKTEDIKSAITLLDRTSNEVREISHNLMPELLQKVGLKEALEGYFARIRSATSMDIHFEVVDLQERLKHSLELTIYRIVQELISNIVKHAQASEVVVQLSKNDELLTITVEDNGAGMNVNAERSGMGLDGIRSRLDPINGTLDIDSSQGKGTSVYIEIFLNK